MTDWSPLTSAGMVTVVASVADHAVELSVQVGTLGGVAPPAQLVGTS
jgi:hypothetical protein